MKKVKFPLKVKFILKYRILTIRYVFLCSFVVVSRDAQRVKLIPAFLTFDNCYIVLEMTSTFA